MTGGVFSSQGLVWAQKLLLQRIWRPYGVLEVKFGLGMCKTITLLPTSLTSVQEHLFFYNSLCVFCATTRGSQGLLLVGLGGP